MYEGVLDPKLKEIIVKLQNQDFMKEYYLAGETGCALQIGHRMSVNLDFFSSKSIDIEKLENDLKGSGDFKIDRTDINTVNGNYEGSRISFMTYNYHLIDNLIPYKDLNIASLKDIGCMKMTAIMHRGVKKDFIDLYCILKELDINLKSLYEHFKNKYEGYDFNEVHLFKSLTFFDEAEKEPMVEIQKNIDWEDVKKYFIENKLTLEMENDFSMGF